MERELRSLLALFMPLNLQNRTAFRTKRGRELFAFLPSLKLTKKELKNMNKQKKKQFKFEVPTCELKIAKFEKVSKDVE